MATIAMTDTIHVAGPWIAGEQRCRQCGAFLAGERHPDRLLRMPYPEDALIISARVYQAISLVDLEPTCTPPPAGQAAPGVRLEPPRGVSDGSTAARLIVASREE
jgi:hypothetical protein